MYPTLFHVLFIRVNSYSVIWFIALAAAIICIINCLKLHGLDEYKTRRVIALPFIFTYIGARLSEYTNHWNYYTSSFTRFLDIVIWLIVLAAAIIWTIRLLKLHDLNEYESRLLMAVSFIFMYIGAKSFEYINRWGYYTIRVASYDVIWFIALAATIIIWTVHRLKLYDLDEYDSRLVMAVSFIFMHIGAKSFEYINHWDYYRVSFVRFLDIVTCLIALVAAIICIINCLKLHGLDNHKSRWVMAVPFILMYVGIRLFVYINHWDYYMADLTKFLDIDRGGVHEFGAVSGAFLSALIMCMFSRSRKVSFSRLCDAVAIPAILAIAIGRWGCFLNGCCIGLPTKFFLGVHFPFDKAGVLRHPVQIYYSVIAFVIVGVLLAAEKKIRPMQKSRHYSVIAPLAVILYCIMRLVTVSVREAMPFSWMMKYSLTYRGIKIALPCMCIWLAYSLCNILVRNRQEKP